MNNQLLKKIFIVVLTFISNSLFAQLNPLTIGTIPKGDSIIVVYSVTITGSSNVSNQGTVRGSNFADVPTNDPKTAAPNDATVTQVVVPTTYFRTHQTGNWNDVNTWESSTVADFSSGVTYPVTATPDFNAGAINIRTGNTVTVTTNVTTDHTFVNGGGILAVATGITLTVNNSGLTVQSTATGTGMIGNSAGTISGNVTVERYISSSGNRAYRMLTPSVNTTTYIHANWQENATSRINNPNPGYGTHITGTTSDQANGFDATATGQGSLFTYNAATPAWVAASNTNATTLNAKTGYLIYIRGDRSVNLDDGSLPSTNTTLRATGSVLQGIQTFTGLSNGSGTTNQTFSLVTNPYASAINWSSIYTNNSSSFENYYTYWDPNISTRGGYVTVTNAGTNSIGGVATVNIQSGQAFFVKTLSAVNSPTLTVQESDKSTTNNIDVFRTQTSVQKFTALLYFNDATLGRRLADGVTALYDAGYSAALDGNDAEEISNFDENIAIARGGKHLSIESRPLIAAKDTLPIFMSNMKQQAYEFEFTPSNFDPNVIAQLIDNYTGNKTPLDITQTAVVPFTITSDAASSAADRFYVTFSASGALPVSLTSVKAYQKNIGVEVEWTTQQENNMDRYEVERSQNGQQFGKIGTVAAKGNSSVALNYALFDPTPLKGVTFYRIKLIDKNGQATYSAIVQVNIAVAPNSITVYPNPVTGNSIALQMNLSKGKYTVTLSNALGQQIASEVIDHTDGLSTEIITPANGLVSGVYQLKIKGEGFSFTKKLIKK